MKPIKIMREIKVLNKEIDEKFVSITRRIDSLVESDKEQFMKHLDITVPQCFKKDINKRDRSLLYNIILHFLFLESIEDVQKVLDKGRDRK